MKDEAAFSLEEFLPYRLVQTAEAVSLEFYRFYRKEYGLTRPEWRVLAHLGQYGAQTARDICDQARLHKTKVSRAVASLEQRGWLKRKEEEADRRFELLELTKEGRKAYNAIGAQAARHNAMLLGRVTNDDARRLVLILDKLDPDAPKAK